MKTYARIANSSVIEIISPITDDSGDEIPIGQRFATEFAVTLVDITSVLPVPQQGWIYNGSKFSAPPAPAPLTPIALAAVALASGLSISSTGTPAINGTYACGPLSQADIVAIETGLNAGKGFPGGATTFNYPDITGTMHAFSEANFTDFAAAVRDFVYGCNSVMSGAVTMLPPSTATIS